MTTENIYVSVIPLPLATDDEFIESVNTFAVKPDMAELNLLQRDGATAVIDLSMQFADRGYNCDVELISQVVGRLSDIQVRDFVLERQECSIFVNGLVALLESVLPHYAAEGKSYLTIAIGCTGGHHRSVAVAEEIGSRLRLAGQPVRVSHRDISR